MKNRILAIFIFTMLALPIQVQAEPDIEPSAPAAEELVQPDIIQEEEASPEIIPNKQPVSRKKLVKKFLLAMGGVAASSLILFLGLSVYNRIRANILNQVKTPEGETPLETPEDLESAVKTFLDKTKWG